MKAEDFPLLRSLAKHPAHFDDAVRILAGSLESGSIRNPVLQQLKHVFGNVVESAWAKAVTKPFFHGGAFESQPKDVIDLNRSIMMLGLHSVIATSKKLAKTKAQGTAVDAMRAVINEALPLAEAVQSLKPNVVMGREPSSPKPVNPSKVVKTCPCCFRSIAVVSSKMAHHGYERPGTGWQTASCPGIRFPPLEVSSEGLVWMIGALKDQRKSLVEAIAAAPLKQTLRVHDVGRQFIEITRESARWDREHRRYAAGLEAQVRTIDAELPTLETQLLVWEPAASLAPDNEPSLSVTL